MAPSWEIVPKHLPTFLGCCAPVGRDLVGVKDPKVAVASVGLATGAGLAQVVPTNTSAISHKNRVGWSGTMIQGREGNRLKVGESLPAGASKEMEFAGTDNGDRPIG